MSLRDWFATKKSQSGAKLDTNAVNSRLSDDELCKLWTQCFNCRENLPTKELQANLNVCPKCGYHFRISAQERIRQLTSEPEDSFLETDATLAPVDPLNFEDTQKYILRQKEAHEKSHLYEAVITGIATVHGASFALGVMDFSYLGGSMGSVVGEKITRLVERAIADTLPVVVFASSGGARMQEGTFSLMQMVKTGAAFSRLHENGLLYVSVLTEPTFGGVTASFGMLGDVILAEEGARIGFAGRRVIEQTIRQKLPSDFQTANYLLHYGQVDQVLPRHQIRPALLKLIQLHQAPGTRQAVF